MKTISVTVNGSVFEEDVPERLLLVDFLPRQRIEGRRPDEIAGELTAMFDRHL